MARRYTPPDGWDVQGFVFALSPTAGQGRALRRFFGARRFAHNWAVDQIRGGVVAYRMTGISTPVPSLYGLRRRWNAEKRSLAVGCDGREWWPEVSKEAFNDGIRGAVEAYWRWQKSRSGSLAGRKVGFPKHHKRGKRRDSFTITRANPAQKLVGRGWVHIPKIGRVATAESTRKLARLVEQGRGEALAVTVFERNGKMFASVRASVDRPQTHNKPAKAEPSLVGVDLGKREHAVIANPEGVIVGRKANPCPLKKALTKMRRLNRRLARRKQGSNRWNQTKEEIAKLHARIARLRADDIHKFTTELVKTHDVIVLEDLNVAGMLKGGGKQLRDAPLGEIRRQILYKSAWYNTAVILADRYFPSTKMCSACRTVGDPGDGKTWTCDTCETTHDRDENAAVNLARYGQQILQNGRVDPVQDPAARSGGTSQAGRSDVRPAPQPAVAQPCKAQTAHAA